MCSRLSWSATAKNKGCSTLRPSRMRGGRSYPTTLRRSSRCGRIPFQAAKYGCTRCNTRASGCWRALSPPTCAFSVAPSRSAGSRRSSVCLQTSPQRRSCSTGSSAPQPDGTSSLRKLQEAVATGRTASLVYGSFDLLYLDGYDLTDVELAIRKQLLRGLLTLDNTVENRGTLRYVHHFEGHGEELYAEICRLSLAWHSLQGSYVALPQWPVDGMARGPRKAGVPRPPLRFERAGPRRYRSPTARRARHGALVPQGCRNESRSRKQELNGRCLACHLLNRVAGNG